MGRGFRVKIAVISDIHSNLEALRVVLNDIDQQQVDRIYCVGDVVGYGPNPCECLDLVMQRCEVCVSGNHDLAAFGKPDGFNPSAGEAIFWTQDRISQSRRSDEYWVFLGDRNPTHTTGHFLFAHGSPSNPANEYLFPEDVWSGQAKLDRNFAMVNRCAFVGHTHVPGIFTSPRNFIETSELNGPYELPEFGRRAIVNVGSVGQPRDGDPRACYVTVTFPGDTPGADDGGELLRYHRLEYPLEETIAKIHQIPGVNNFLGDRLREGR